jgi:hypothetical protein
MTGQDTYTPKWPDGLRDADLRRQAVGILRDIAEDLDAAPRATDALANAADTMSTLLVQFGAARERLMRVQLWPWNSPGVKTAPRTRREVMTVAAAEEIPWPDGVLAGLAVSAAATGMTCAQLFGEIEAAAAVASWMSIHEDEVRAEFKPLGMWPFHD